MDQKRKLFVKPKTKESSGFQKIEKREINSGGLKGTLPFKTAAVIKKSTEAVPKEVKEFQKEVLDEVIEIPEKEMAKAVKQPPTIIDFEDLPEQKKEEITEFLKSTTPAKKTEAPLKFIPTDPSVAEAMMLAEKTAIETERREANPKPEAMAEAKNLEPTKCTHCGWPVDSHDLCNPTDVDKRIFVASILGQKRFTKEYSLFNGQLKVIFRSLTVPEIDMVIDQVMYDWNKNKISGPAHSVTEATKYQLALALDSIETDSGIVKLPMLDEYDTEDKLENNTILPLVREKIYETALTTESLRKVVTKTYTHFLDTVAKLEAMAETPDFW